jgi:hypothetical protein
LDWWQSTEGKPLSYAELMVFQDHLCNWLVLNREFHGKETFNLFEDAYYERLRCLDITLMGFPLVVDAEQCLLASHGSHRAAALRYHAEHGKGASAETYFIDLEAIGFKRVHAVMLSDLLQVVADNEKPQPRSVGNILSNLTGPFLVDALNAVRRCQTLTHLSVGCALLPIVQQHFQLKDGVVNPLTGQVVQAKQAAQQTTRATRVIVLYLIDYCIANLGLFPVATFLLSLLTTYQMTAFEKSAHGGRLWMAGSGETLPEGPLCHSSTPPRSRVCSTLNGACLLSNCVGYCPCFTLP